MLDPFVDSVGPYLSDAVQAYSTMMKQMSELSRELAEERAARAGMSAPLAGHPLEPTAAPDPSGVGPPRT